MKNFMIETATTGREVYTIEAESAEDALIILYNNAPAPAVSEVISFEVTSIKEEE